MNVLILHYTHPEGYPPTFNAINCISKKASSVTILSTDTLPTNWNYDKNVELILLKGEHDRFKHVNRSKFDKLLSYYNYIKQICRLLKKRNVDLLIIYDNVPFLFYQIASFFVSKKIKLWYHNHDVYPLSHYKKYSVNWFGAKSVQDNFDKIDFFSLPAVERKKMYPFKLFKGKFFFIPNYPSKNIIKPRETPIVLPNKQFIKIVYPGSPSDKNGFKELINTMTEKVNDKLITLTIVGDIKPSYKAELTNYANKLNVGSQLFFNDRIPYTEMSMFLKNFEIGWALYKPVDLSVATAGSSSNKIYEFLANGLPIIVFDNEHHKEHLSSCNAAFYSDLSKTSILATIKSIDSNFVNLSKLARQDFEDKYQFEFVFNPIFNEIKDEVTP